MNCLTNFKRFALTLIILLVGVKTWAQVPEEPIELMQIDGVADFYQYTGSAIDFGYTIYDEDNHVVTEHITAVVTYNNGTVSETNIINKGKYTLTVTGDGINYTGTLTKVFYVSGTTFTQGEGTESTPYMINTADDWNTLAASLYLTPDDGANPSLGKFYKLGANISVETMVGKNYNAIPFRGIFDGNNDTITFNKGTLNNKFDEAYCAPFRYTCGATIHDLTVVGDIYTEEGGAGGLIGYNDNYNVASVNTIIENVVVGVNINNTEDVFYDAGIVAYGPGVRFINCVYNGLLDSFSWGGGFTPYGDENTYVENCLFNPDPNSKSWGENFVSYDSWGDYTNPFRYPENIVDGYYTKQTSISYNWGDVLSTQGISAYSPLTLGNIGHYEKTILGNEIYTAVDVVISGIEEDYLYTGNNISINYSVTYNNGANAIPTVCSAVITDSNGEVLVDDAGNPIYYVKEIGIYNFVVVGNEANYYYGSKIKTFSVVSGGSYGSWSDLQALLNGETNPIELDCDYRASSSDAVLTIDRDVTINMNGHTIDRHLSTARENGWVLKINSGKTVVINGNGTITGGYNKAYSNNENNRNDGGGINNLGNLTLNIVTVTANRVIKLVAGSERYTARGGGIFSGEGSTFVMNGGSVSGNTAEGGGGGIYGKKTASFTMTGVNISGNECLDKGGGVRIMGSATITDCDIRNNVLRTKNVSDGGGIYFDGKDNGVLTMTNSTIRGNQSTRQGGGLFVLSGRVNMTNSSVTDNFAFDYDGIGNENYGGGICMYGGSLYMDNVTVTGNISRQDGCGIYIREGGARMHIQNYIRVFDNYKTEEIAGHRENNNVYLTQTSTKISVDAELDPLSYIGIIKNGSGDFTTGLAAKGSIANFASDKEDLYVVPSGGEAKMAELTPFPGGENVTVNGPMVIDDRTTTEEITISGDGILYIENSGYIDAIIHNDVDETRLIIEDGGQVIVKEDPLGTQSVPATIKKNIEDGVWYLISSAMANPKIIENTNLITEHSTGFPSYDLFRFNDGATLIDEQNRVLYWENYRNTAYHGVSATNPFDEMANCRGYLYRNYYDQTLTIDGNLNTRDVDSYVLSYHDKLTYNESEHDNIFKGFNIIGNPYSHNITKKNAYANILNGDLLEENFYRLSTEGTWYLNLDDTATIRTFEGIMVQAKSGADGRNLTITYLEPSPAVTKGIEKAANRIWLAVSNEEFEDGACVTFKEGHGLNKIAHLNEEAPMLYINHNGEDFASVDLNEDTKVFDLYFEAKTTGFYTLNVSPRGDFNYLHLIDKLAGKDIDLLEENEYTFIGSAADSKDRFVVRLGLSNNSESSENVFAYQSGDDIVVEGEGELQIFDVMGRLVSSQYVNGVVTWSAASVQSGVYILRFNEMTQKIVVK